MGSQLKVSAGIWCDQHDSDGVSDFSSAPGDYTSTTNVTLSDSTSGATIHCTTDGSPYRVGRGRRRSDQFDHDPESDRNCEQTDPTQCDSHSMYAIDIGAPGINYGADSPVTGLTLNGSAKLNGTRLRLTDGGGTEAGGRVHQHAH